MERYQLRIVEHSFGFKAARMMIFLLALAAETLALSTLTMSLRNTSLEALLPRMPLHVAWDFGER